MRTRALVTVLALLAASIAIAAPATSASRVSITNSQGTSKADPKYATTIKVSGAGFQSIKGGHGGIYVFFGTVKGQWRPSKGGQTGRNYLYVPDSESRGNQGFQKFVAFPGSDTASSANGGEIKADGTWSTSMVVPGATFKAVDRSGRATTVDCLKDTCGIITVGAHGVKNARNETFTPVSFADLTGGKAPDGATSGTGGTAGTTPSAEPSATAAAPTVRGRARLTVDRATAVPGRVMTFNATGLNPGDQVVASFDDGLAAVGPLNVGLNGQVAGALTLPADTTAGTHQLKLTGSKTVAPLNFPVAPVTAPVAADADEATPWLPIAFAAAAGVLLLGALAFSVARVRSLRRKGVAHAV